MDTDAAAAGKRKIEASPQEVEVAKKQKLAETVGDQQDEEEEEEEEEDAGQIFTQFSFLSLQGRVAACVCVCVWSAVCEICFSSAES